MEIIGKLFKVLPSETGTSARGPWTRGAFVIETEEQFPRKIVFSLWGEDKVAAINAIRQGEQIKVHFSPESREYNERWYTDLRCFRIDTFNPAVAATPSSMPASGYQQPPVQFQQPSSQPTQFEPQAQEPEGTFNSSAVEDDDLPF